MPVSKQPNKVIPVVKRFNMLRIDYCDDFEFNAAMQETMIVRRKELVRERRRTRVEYSEEPVYELRQSEYSDKKYYVMPVGFYYRLEAVAKQLGAELRLVDKTPMDGYDEDRLTCRDDLVDSIPWRENQLEIVQDVLQYERGQYVASTGAGKSYAIAMLTRIYPKAKFLVTAVRQSTLDSLHKEISDAGTYCGIYSSKVKDLAGRVLCCSVGMLHHVAHEDWDFLILDEKHQCATIKRIQALTAIRCRYAYAFSANHEERNDGADDWLEAMFGACRVRHDYTDAISEGSVAPVRVKWLHCDKVLESRLHKVSATEPYFDKVVYARNMARNLLIRKAAMKCAEHGQTLVYVSWVEHIYRLRQLLKCPVVHAVPNAEDWDRLIRRKLVDKDELIPTKKQFDEITAQFHDGELNLVIANSVWEVAMNFPYLKYLIRGDWSASMSACRQISGRLSRKSEGKTEGVLIDICDSYNDAALRRSERRKQSYDKIGYEQSGWPTNV